MTNNELTYEIIGAAMDVHRELGPGLLENVYEDALAIELKLRGLSFQRQMQMPLKYKGHRIGSDLRLDLLLTYLKLTQSEIGLLINFNVPVLKQGIKRMLNKK